METKTVGNKTGKSEIHRGESNVSDPFADPTSACKTERKSPLNRAVKRVPKNGKNVQKTTRKRRLI